MIPRALHKRALPRLNNIQIYTSLPTKEREKFELSLNLHQRAMAVLEFAARTAGAQGIATGALIAFGQG